MSILRCSNAPMDTLIIIIIIIIITTTERASERERERDRQTDRQRQRQTHTERECFPVPKVMCVLIQRFNAILLHDSFESTDHLS